MRIIFIFITILITVVQQPKGNYSYVDDTYFTQFGLASTIGLLVHNNPEVLSLEEGDKVTIGFEDGSTYLYYVYHIDEYQRVIKNGFDIFIDLKDGTRYNEFNIFKIYYTVQNLYRDNLILQTCIEKNGKKSWGVRFVIALPIKNIGKEMK